MRTSCIVSCSEGACIVSGGVCYAKPVPDLCSGAITNSSIYNIGKINAVLPGYNPSNTWISAYNFTTTDLQSNWQPAIYHISSGIITVVNSGGLTSNAGISNVCHDTYNANADEYWVISWYEPAISAGGGTS